MKVFTYKDQPWDNVDAWRLGEACRKAAQNPGGDYIDGGLELLKQLQDKGFGVVKLEAAQHPTSAPDSSVERDAARYRWIAKQRNIWAVLGDEYNLPSEFEGANNLDEAIDAAIAAKEKP